MKRAPPLTQADRVLLSRALLAVAAHIEDLWAELDARGIDRPGAIVREAMLAFAERVPMGSSAGLRAYWRELAMEELSHLDSPRDVLRGHYVAPYGYRSALIAGLREKAHLLPTNERIPSPQIEPAFKAWVEMMGGEKETSWQATVDARRRQALALGEPELPGFAAMDRWERMALLRERYARTFDAEGFKLVAPSRKFTHFRRRTSDERYVFSLLDDSGDGLAYGRISVEFAITWPGTQITSAQLYAMRLAAFRPEILAPNFRYTCAFERDSWPEFCLAADNVARFTLIVFRRLDAELQRLHREQD